MFSSETTFPNVSRTCIKVVKMLPIIDSSRYLTGARILLIDDSESFQSITTEMLNNVGVASVTVASTLTAGMHLMHYNRSNVPDSPAFDLVLMDVNLPDGNGMDGCEFISSHAESYNIPVVVITGAFNPAVVIEAFEAGASDYLQKPLILDLLKIRLGLLLKVKSLSQSFDDAAAGL